MALDFSFCYFECKVGNKLAVDKTADLAFITEAWVTNLIIAMIPEKERVGGNYYLTNFLEFLFCTYWM